MFYCGKGLSFFGVKNNNQIRGYVSHTCCALIASESRCRLTRSRTEAETHAVPGCVMSEEALWASDKATVVCVSASANEDWFAGLRCSINRRYNKRGSERSRRQVVLGDGYRHCCQ